MPTYKEDGKGTNELWVFYSILKLEDLGFGEAKHLPPDHTVNILDTDLNPILSLVFLHISRSGASRINIIGRNLTGTYWNHLIGRTHYINAGLRKNFLWKKRQGNVA